MLSIIDTEPQLLLVLYILRTQLGHETSMKGGCAGLL